MISRQGSDQFTGIASSASEGAGTTGNAGAIVVRAQSIALRDLGAIASDSSGGGDAGLVKVNAGRIELREGGQISSLTLPVFNSGQLVGGSTGRGGTVRVVARKEIVIAGEALRTQLAPMLQARADGTLQLVQIEVAPPSSITASTESPAGRSSRQRAGPGAGDPSGRSR